MLLCCRLRVRQLQKTSLLSSQLPSMLPSWTPCTMLSAKGDILAESAGISFCALCVVHIHQHAVVMPTV